MKECKPDVYTRYTTKNALQLVSPGSRNTLGCLKLSTTVKSLSPKGVAPLKKLSTGIKDL
jgi:hypothetical protein